MFLRTLSIGSFTVQSWVSEVTDVTTGTSEGERSRKPKRLVRFKEALTFLDDFLENIPKLPSHYYRKETQKIYLEPHVETLKEFMDVYKSECVKENKTTVSRKVFKKTMSNKNISLYKPKKARRDVCVAHEVGNISEEEWKKHCEKKEREREEKSIDKTNAQEGS